VTWPATTGAGIASYYRQTVIDGLDRGGRPCDSPGAPSYTTTS
jgi:hypothetical protein